MFIKQTNKQKGTNAGKDVGGKKKPEPFYTVGWYINGYSHYGKECGGFSTN